MGSARSDSVNPYPAPHCLVFLHEDCGRDFIFNAALPLIFQILACRDPKPKKRED
jgi:hypothetical protein